MSQNASMVPLGQSSDGPEDPVSHPRQPMHVVISEQLREWIEAGQYAPGERLPSEFDLGEKFGVSRTTVRRAISNLIQQGLVTTQQGKGIFVSDRQKISFSLSSPLMYFDAELRRQGHTGSVQTLRFQQITPPGEVRRKLNLPADAAVYWQEKIIFADEMPIALDITYYPESIGRPLEDMLKQGFTYSTLASNGYRLASSEVCLESIPATYKLSEYLDVPLGTPLHLYRYVAAGSDGQQIVCGETISRCDRTCYLAHIVSESVE